ncbi:MAG: hypothetical protein ACLFTK_09325 [Anaerolineales bacterium]
MSDEIAGLYVSIGADLSGLLAALDTTRAALDVLAADGGLLGALPAQTVLLTAAMAAGVRQQVAPLPGIMQRALVQPYTDAMAAIPQALAPLPSMLETHLKQPTLRTLDELAALVAARGAALLAQVHALIDQINRAAEGLRFPPNAGAVSIPGRAAGGPVSGGQPYIVGEAGPELFVPGRSGHIVPNHALRGGEALSIRGGTFHFYGVTDPEALYDELRRVAEHRAT